MPLQFGSSAVSAVKFGGNAVQAIYFGSQQVWTACPPYTGDIVDARCDGNTTIYLGHDGNCGLTEVGQNAGNDCSNMCAVTGCTDPSATNYNPGAWCDDGSCCFYDRTEFYPFGCWGCEQAIGILYDYDSCGNVIGSTDYFYEDTQCRDGC